MPNWIAIIKTETHTEPEYEENTQADFHATSASTKIVSILFEFEKTP